MEMTLKALLACLQHIADYHQNGGHVEAAAVIREAIARLKQTGRRAKG